MSEKQDCIVLVDGLRKSFAGQGKVKIVEAVRGITFQVRTGEIFGLLGPNGAGKTTTMRILTTLLTPTEGSVAIAGFDLQKQQDEIRRSIGYVSQKGGMQRSLTGRENLFYQAELYGMDKKDAYVRVTELLNQLGIAAIADRKIETYSGGQRRMFDLAAGIVHRPCLLFLDEPTTGLDPQNRAHVWRQVQRLNQEGTTIFLTTHYLEEADILCNHVAIIDQGKIVALASPVELKRQIAGDIITLGFSVIDDAQRAVKVFEKSIYTKEMHPQDAILHVYVDQGDEALPIFIKMLHDANITPKMVRLSRPTLDDVFLKLTGHALQSPEALV